MLSCQHCNHHKLYVIFVGSYNYIHMELPNGSIFVVVEDQSWISLAMSIGEIDSLAVPIFFLASPSPSPTFSSSSSS